MINKTQRKKLIRVIGTHYTSGVLEILSEKQILNKEGKPFSPGFISHVMNGRREHLEVEVAILDYYQKCVSEKKKMEFEKRELLENKKPEAATSGS